MHKYGRKSMHKLRDYVEELNETIPKIVSRFDFERSIQVVGRSNTDDSSLNEFIDPDIHDGTMLSSNGYARLARHKPTGTICLITSKASVNLRGIMQDDGTIIASREGLRQSYISGAYRTDGEDDSIYTVAQKLRRAYRRFCEDLGERSEKHFTLYGATFNKAAIENSSTTPQKSETASKDDEIVIYTNGRITYEISKKKDKYHVRFIAPTSRKDGSFIPIHIKKKGLSRYFSSVSKTVNVSDNFENAQNAMMQHWQNLSSKLWDEKNIFEGEGTLFRAKKGLADVANLIFDRGPKIAFVTLVVGATIGLFSPKYGIITGIGAAIIHTALDLIVDEGYVASAQAMKRSREARRKLDISAYNFGEDVSDHFKIQTPDNISRLCAKMDLERFKADEFEFLRAEESKMLLDHEKPLDGFRPSSLRAHLLFVHQRGFSSNCFLPDSRTRVDAHQSGLVRLLHEKPDGKILLFARYRGDICTAEHLRMPDDKRNRMGDKIWAFEYDRSRTEFHHAFKRIPGKITLDTMMEDLEKNLLFKEEENLSDDHKQRALTAIRDLFDTESVDPNANPQIYLSGRASYPPLAPVL